MTIERIGIGCPTYRGHARVANLLESIARRNPGVDLGKLDIMIHDDGSPGDIPRSTYLALYKTLDIGVGNIHISKSSNNKGIAPAWNHLSTQLIQRGADMIILLNDDILVVDDWIRPMEYFLANNPKAGAASWGFYWFDPIDVPALLENPENVRPRTYDSKQVDEQGNRKHVDRWEPGNARPGRLGAPSGCCFAFTKQMYQLSGGFPDEYRSFHEESVSKDRRTVILNRDGFVEFPTFEELFDRCAVSSVFSFGNPDVLPSPDIRILGVHNGKAIWDKVKYVVRHPNQNRSLCHVITKEGETEVTEDHSIIVSGQEVTVATLEQRVEEAAKLSGSRLAETLVEAGITGKPGAIARQVVESGSLHGAATVLGMSRAAVGVRLRYAQSHSLRKEKPPTQIDTVTTIPPVPEINEIDLKDWAEHEFLSYDNQHIIAFRRHNMTEEPSSTMLPKRIDRYITGEAKIRALVRLLGLYVSEGHIISNRKHQMYGVSFASGDRNYLVEIQQEISMLFGRSTFISKQTKEPYKPVYSLNLRGRDISLLFESLCGRYSSFKKLPPFVFSLPHYAKETLFKELIRGDGFRWSQSTRPYAHPYRNTNSFAYTTISERLAAQVSFLCKQLGYNVAMRINPKRGSYDIRNRKRSHPRVDGFKVFRRNSHDYVYDVETEHGHTFVDACGLLLLHNSSFGFKLCKQGFPSFSPPYPFLWHQWSATFNECPELKSSETMTRSRQLFCKDFGVPTSYSNNPFDFVHPRLCSNIPAFEISWISKNGIQRDISPECGCEACVDFRKSTK